MSGQKISDERLAEIEARASVATPGPWSPLLTDVLCHGTPEGDWVVACDVVGDGDAAFIGAARTDVPDLVADLRAARAEIERYKEAHIRQEVLDMGPAWACSACKYIYRGRLKKTCPECGRVDYFSGSVRVDALAKYDAEQAAIIRARGPK